jgi:signal transduction histidine kinase
LPKIFLPFYTTKANGTGLGLAVVQKIIVQHGGAVEARNQLEGGAEFIFWLPLRRVAAQAVDSASQRI